MMAGPVTAPGLVQALRRIGQRPGEPVTYSEPLEFVEAPGHIFHASTRDSDLDVGMRPGFGFQVEVDRPAACNCPRQT
jgi:hypothetical protein